MRQKSDVLARSIRAIGDYLNGAALEVEQGNRRGASQTLEVVAALARTLG
jgi:hypothetical protein